MVIFVWESEGASPQVNDFLNWWAYPVFALWTHFYYLDGDND